MRQQRAYPMLTKAERDRRFALARSFLGERDLDVLILTGGGSRIAHYWITNQFYLSNEPEGVVLFPRESAPVLLLPRNRWGLVHTDLREGVEPWIEDFRLNEPLVGTIASILRERGLERGRAGVITASGESPFGSLADPLWHAIDAELGGLEAEDVAKPFTIATLPHSAEELELARAAGRAAEAAGAALVEPRAAACRRSSSTPPPRRSSPAAASTGTSS